MDLEQTIGHLDTLIADPRTGVPEAVFQMLTRVTPIVNVDLLIANDAGDTLLTWRDDPLYLGWHVPGGVLRFQELMADRVAAVARLELGTSVTLRRREPLAINEVLHPERRIRGHFISFLFECDLTAPPDEALRQRSDRPEPGQWAWHRGCPADIIPSHEMYRRFLNRR